MSKANILVVDDEKEIVDLLSWRLGMLGYSVDTAGGCIEARDRLKEKSYSIIISDYKMNDGTGLDVLSHRSKNSYFIIISGYADIGEKELLEKGVNCFLSKPFAFSDLINKIQSIEQNQ